MTQSVLITGGAGFIGSHLCDKFLKEGFEVIAMDNLSTGSLDNLAHLQNNKKFEFIEHDITFKITLSKSIDYILNFASPASPIDYLKKPIPTLKVGSIGTYHLLGLAKVKKARILMASTSEIYGSPLIHPQHEEYWGNVNPIGPRSVYDEAKRFLEAITMSYHMYHGIDTAIVRIFNTYGPRMSVNDGRALPNFISQVLKNENITIYGSGSQTRSFMYIDDLIEGIYALLMSSYHLPVNLGNPDEITILDFAKEIIQLTQSKSQIVNCPLPQDDPPKRKPDISRAKRLLNWHPKVERKVGLEKTFAYFKSKIL